MIDYYIKIKAPQSNARNDRQGTIGQWGWGEKRVTAAKADRISREQLRI
jgi:hypothetical protein